MRVLFVDDEPNILSGIRRMMHRKRNEWDMDFVSSGPEAIAKIDEAPCDVIVSDMYMPGMDGAELLSTVKEKLPGTIRIALSGQTDQNMIYRCIQNAHQYLAKPCDADVLIETVHRACMLRDLLEDEELATRVKEMSSIPSLPEQYQKIMEELQSDDPSMQKIGEIVESDVAMTAKILQMVNSAFFGLAQHVSTPSQAAMLLGVDVIRSLVLTSGVVSQFDESICEKMHLQSVWSRSAEVGSLAKAIAMEETNAKLLADYAFMAGMLMDVGRFVLASNMSDDEADTYQAARDNGDADWKVERDLFGQSHMEVGAYLVGLWGLPNPIVAAVAYHHTPSAYSCNDFSPLTAVHAALAIIEANGSDVTQELDVEYMESLNLNDRIEGWQNLYQNLLADN